MGSFNDLFSMWGPFLLLFLLWGGAFYVLMVVFFGLAYPPPPPYKHLYGRQCPGCPNEEKNVAKRPPPPPTYRKVIKIPSILQNFFSRGAHNLAPPPPRRVLYMPPPSLAGVHGPPAGANGPPPLGNYIFM